MVSREDGDERRVTWHTLGTAPIDDYVSDVLFIWGEHDEKRSLLEIWARVVEHASRLAEGLRRETYDQVQVELAGVLIWVFSFVGQANSRQGEDDFIRLTPSVADIIYNKFPWICHVCEHEECTCLINLQQAESRNERNTVEDPAIKRKRLRTRADEQRRCRPDDLDGFEHMFNRIYNRNIFASHINTIGFHLLEEIGEVSKALLAVYSYGSNEEVKDYRNRIGELEDELADVLSWVFSLSLKLRLVFQTFDRYMERLQPGRWKLLEPDITLASAVGHKYCNSDPPYKLYCKFHCGSDGKCGCKLLRLESDDEAARVVRAMLAGEG